MTVITRFAPSPTGFLHIGGARTALFNWLFARGRGGQFLLRIEDTDRARSTEAAIAAIMDGMRWLGLEADGPPIFQFARAGRHREAAEEMVARGRAFRCYVTAEELEARRLAGEAAREALKAAKATGATALELERLQEEVTRLVGAFRSPYRDGGVKPPGPNAPFVVRLRAPDDGDIVNDDLVQGVVRVRSQDVDDLVMLRADATPTYMLAVVVDDHDMGVTHIIRGDDHLTNAARQIPIYQALDWPVPAFAHVPMIHGPDGAKLSKRHGAQAVQEFRELGYLPEAVCNYLLRLGWSHGDDEIISRDDAIRWFDLDHVGKAPARLDWDKLAAINAHYIKHADHGRLADLTLAHGREAFGWDDIPEGVARARLAGAMSVLKSRARTIPELAAQARFLMARRPLELDAAAQKALKEEVCARIARLIPALERLDVWEEAPLAAAIKGFADAEGVGLGQIGPGVRAALTGGAQAPDLGQILSTLGREEALGRLRDQIS